MSTIATGATAKKSWVWIWKVLGLILAAYIFEQDIEWTLLDLNLLPQAGTLSVITVPAPERGPGQFVVKVFQSGSPLPGAGVAPGDHIRFDRLFDAGRIYRLNEPVGFTLNHQGRLSHRIVKAVPFSELDSRRLFYNLAFNLADVVSLLIGAFILLRSRRNLATMALGGALISFALTSYSPQFWESGPSTFTGFLALNYGAVILEAVLFATFAALFYRDNGGRVSRWVWWVLAGYAAVFLILNEFSGFTSATAVQLAVIGDAAVISGWFELAGFAVTFAFLTAGWRRSSRDTRRRYTLLLVAISSVILAQALQIAWSTLAPVADYRHTPWILIYDALGGAIAPLLFAYAILRHRVLDLGFAINRTLVYSVVSVILLIGFGLVEWASEKLIPIESREKSLFVDAALALGVFLVFHRLRDFAEQFIEEIFFRSWRDKEKALRQFVTEAAFILRRPALMAGLIKALNRFTGGAEVALYLPGATRDYCLAEGAFAGLGEQLDGDDKTLVRLRAARKLLETGDGALALPMIHRNELSGLVVVGHKPSGDAWRPDELEVLAWAVLQAGHDLHALKLEQLEADATALRQKVDILTAQVVELAKAR